MFRAHSIVGTAWYQPAPKDEPVATGPGIAAWPGGHEEESSPTSSADFLRDGTIGDFLAFIGQYASESTFAFFTTGDGTPRIHRVGELAAIILSIARQTRVKTEIVSAITSASNETDLSRSTACRGHRDFS